MKKEKYNIIQLHHLFDIYIYSQINEENDYSRKTIKTNIDWSKILQFIDSSSLQEIKNDIHSSMYSYAQTFVTVYKENDFFTSYPLVQSAELTETGLLIEHNAIALKHYLQHFDKNVEVWNRNIEKLLQNLKSPAYAIYPYLCNGYENTISIEQLKNELGSTLSNPQFVYRIIKPIEAEILSLYDQKMIPFYIKVESQKSKSGSGGRLLGVTFKIIDEVSLIRQSRLLPDYLEYLEEQLLCIYPMEYPLLMEQIKNHPSAYIEEVYNAIKYISIDPIAYELPIDRVVRTKLETHFDIQFP